jgi:hypothetical protein
MNLDFWDKLAKTMLSGVTILAIIFGGLFSLNEYLERKQENKVARTLDLVDAYSKEDVISAQQDLDWHYDKNIDAINAALDSENFTEDFSAIIIQLIEKHDLSRQVDRLFYFYRTVAICTLASLCDKSTVESYFKHQGVVFFNQYYPYICQRRLVSGDNGIWMTVQEFFKPNLARDFCTATQLP